MRIVDWAVACRSAKSCPRGDPKIAVGEVPPVLRTVDPLGFSAERTGIMSKVYQKYSPEFREEVAKLVVDTSRAMADVARE
jgi:hypothetical protein